MYFFISVYIIFDFEMKKKIERKKLYIYYFGKKKREKI